MAKKIEIPTEKIITFFRELHKKIQEFFGDIPDIIRNAPTDEKIAYGVIIAGIVFLIVGIVL